LDLEGDDAVSVLELDRLDVADLHARHPQALALARHHGLGGLELGLELERLLLEDRNAQALLLDDVQRDRQRDDHQHGDGDEVAQVLADRGAHHSPPPRFSISCWNSGKSSSSQLR
jgi:hypothetical protein